MSSCRATNAKRVRFFRELAGLSVADLAGLVGVSVAAVYFWEGGRNTPSLDNASAIASACGVSMQAFFGKLPDPPKVEAGLAEDGVGVAEGA